MEAVNITSRCGIYSTLYLPKGITERGYSLGEWRTVLRARCVSPGLLALLLPGLSSDFSSLVINVLGTVRDPGNHKKVGRLWNLGGAKERLELVRADLWEEWSFDDAVMACEGVFHTASPVITKADSYGSYL